MRRAIVAAALIAGAAAAGGASMPLPDEVRAVPVGYYAEVLEDAGGALTLHDLTSPALAPRFAPAGMRVPNFGYTYSTFWLRFQLPTDTSRLLVPLLVLEIRYPSIDSIELHVPYRGAGGALEYAVQRGGDQMPFDAREVKHRNHVFRIPTSALAEAPVFLRVQSQSVLTVPAYLWRPEALIAADRNAFLLYGMLYGLLIALGLYNAMLWFALRDSSYLWYVLNVATFGTGLAALDGFAFQYLWPGSVWLANSALGMLLWATLLFASQFARTFLDMARMAPRVDRLLLGVIAASVVGVLACASGEPAVRGVALRALSVVAFATVTVVLATTARALLRGYRPARFYLLAQAALLVFVALGTLRNFALVPTSFLTVNGLHIGLAIDALLLSFALADRINALKLATVAAQAEVRQRDRLMEQLRHMAQHDSLTGLPNRVSMQQRLSLAIELAKRNRKKLAVMMVDLDGFKRLNDQRGHVVGDHALSAIAGRLRTSVRGSDTVARYGGDEFVVLAGELDRGEDVGTIAEKVADMVSLPLSVDGVTERITCSIGISLYPDDARDGEALIERADRAMYAAKNAKTPQRYAFFSAA